MIPKWVNSIWESRRPTNRDRAPSGASWLSAAVEHGGNIPPVVVGVQSDMVEVLPSALLPSAALSYSDAVRSPTICSLSDLSLAKIVQLILNADHVEAMRSHAEQAYPHECCGVLLGTVASQNYKKLVAVRAVENTWSEDIAQELQDDGSLTKTRRYSIAPQVMLEAMRDARKQGLDLIGIYHSHPDHPAVPSECDRRLAWPQYSYVILSVLQGIAQDIQSWQLNQADQFQSEAIVIQPHSSHPHSTV